jgi:hypothetical protein
MNVAREQRGERMKVEGKSKAEKETMNNPLVHTPIHRYFSCRRIHLVSYPITSYTYIISAMTAQAFLKFKHEKKSINK